MSGAIFGSTTDRLCAPATARPHFSASCCWGRSTVPWTLHYCGSGAQHVHQERPSWSPKRVRR
eukprot:3076428-Pyramimonas_sp.AAC.1